MWMNKITTKLEIFIHSLEKYPCTLFLQFFKTMAQLFECWSDASFHIQVSTNTVGH
mgnify:CR=1 FL=1